MRGYWIKAETAHVVVSSLRGVKRLVLGNFCEKDRLDLGTLSSRCLDGWFFLVSLPS